MVIRIATNYPLYATPPNKRQQMKPHHAIIVGLAIGVLAGAVLMYGLRKPCPDLPVPSDDSATVAREIERDSIEHERRVRARILDSLAWITPPQRHEQSLRIVRSIRRSAQLDSLRADPR